MSVYIGSLCNKFDSHIIYIYLIYTSSYDLVVGYIPNYDILLLIYLIELLIQSLFSFILIMFVVFTRILSYHPSTLLFYLLSSFCSYDSFEPILEFHPCHFHFFDLFIWMVVYTCSPYPNFVSLFIDFISSFVHHIYIYIYIS